MHQNGQPCSVGKPMKESAGCRLVKNPSTIITRERFRMDCPMDREGCNMWEAPVIPENGTLVYIRDWGFWFGKMEVTLLDNLSRACLMGPEKNTLPTASRIQVSGRKAITGISPDSMLKAKS